MQNQYKKSNKKYLTDSADELKQIDHKLTKQSKITERQIEENYRFEYYRQGRC